jgi:hypothetical protein
MRAVRRSTAERGILPGPVPVGYRRIDGRLEQTPAAEAVRVAFQMYCTGDYGSMRITDAMNATGHTMPDGTPFKVTAVDETPAQSHLRGFVPCGESALPRPLHEPIIDAATWERAQAVAAARAKRRPQPQRRATRSSRDSPYARAAVPRCGTPGGAEHPVYMCSAHVTRNHGLSPDVVCSGAKSNAPYVEHATCAWLAGLALAPGLLDQARVLMEHETPPIAVAPMRATDQALKKLKQDFLSDKISAAEYEAQRTVLLAQPTAVVPAPVPVDSEAVLKLVADLADALSRGVATVSAGDCAKVGV